MMKHTPGPWVYRKDYSGCPYVGSKNKVMVADVNMAFVSGAEADANARLIAAAPDLYEACIAARAFIRNGIALGYISMPSDDVPDPAHKTPVMIDAAIAKAEGK